MDTIQYPLITFYPETGFKGKPLDVKSNMSALNGMKSYKVIRGTWMLYSDDSFKGDEVTVKEDEECTSKNIKSAKLEASINPGVIFYPEPSYRGIPLYVNSNAAELPLMKSYEVHRGTWTLYADSKFTGAEVTAQEGDSNGFTSVRSAEQAKEPSGAVCIFTEPHFQGKARFLDKSEKCLTEMKSYKVYKGLWRFYPEPKFVGKGVDGYPGCFNSDADFRSAQRF